MNHGFHHGRLFTVVSLPLRLRSHPPRPHLPSVITRRYTAAGARQQRFTPLVPPDPASLPKRKPRSRRRAALLRYALYTGLAAGAVYLADRQWNASSVTRSARTFYNGVLIGCDYKINFRAHPPLADSIEALHARNAQRVFDLIRANGGLYLKIGQAIAMQSAILPPQFQKMFARMFDDAPQNEWRDVEKVIREDFGKGPEEVFGVSFDGEPGKGVMEKVAQASASVAQVHWARLADGREVAIKIQKREIAQQIGWDLWAFKVVSRVYSWWFDIPMYTLVPYISERLLLETDFINEANNSELMDQHIKAEPRLRNRVYIPKIYRELSSKRVMVAEWFVLYATCDVR
jgi:aarF domain-containing kinase